MAIGWGYVYVIEGRLGGRLVYYVGSTKRPLEKRIMEHMKGYSGYTRKMKRKKLVWALKLPKINCRAVEYELKGRKIAVRQMFDRRKPSFQRMRNILDGLKMRGIKYEILDISKVQGLQKVN